MYVTELATHRVSFVSFSPSHLFPHYLPSSCLSITYVWQKMPLIIAGAVAESMYTYRIPIAIEPI